VSITRLLDAFAPAGAMLAKEDAGHAKQAAALVLPVWEWLNQAARQATDLSIEWPVLDVALSDDSTDRLISALEAVTESVSNGGGDRLELQVRQLHDELTDALVEAQDYLRREGIEEQTIAALFLPLRRELTSWEVRRESTRVLGQARDALSEMGGKNLAMSFEEQFATDLQQANRLRIVAFGLFLAAILFSGAVYLGVRHDVAPADVTARIAVGVSFIALGGLAIRESSRHRADANVWRTVQLQLNTIDAYCSSLPRDKADTLRFILGCAVFSGRLFPAGHETGSTASDDGRGTDVSDTIMAGLRATDPPSPPVVDARRSRS
jgi:hypothetical protein